MSVIISGNALDVGLWKELCEPFGDDDDAIVSSKLLASDHHRDHFVDDGIHVHDFACLGRGVGIGDGFSGSQVADDVFDA